VFDGLKAVLRYRNVLLLLIIPGVMSGLTVSFSGLWGVPFLTTHYALTETNAAGLCSTLMIAWAIGCLSFGALSDRIGRRKPIFIGGVFVALSLWAALVFSAKLSYPVLITILAAIGFFGGSFIVTFAFAKESVPARYAGTVSGVSNMGVMLGPMFLQPLIGVVLDAHWQGATLNGKRIFDLASYQQAFSMVLIWGAVSLVLLFFTRETYCRQTP
jgi:MFS family permease